MNSTEYKGETMKEFAARKTYFRNDPQFGRTTTLFYFDKPVLEVMGISTLKTLKARWLELLTSFGTTPTEQRESK